MGAAPTCENLQSAESCTSISTTGDQYLQYGYIYQFNCDQSKPLEEHRQDLKSLRRQEVDATESEQFQLYSHAEAYPKATQQQLAQWFNNKFKK